MQTKNESMRQTKALSAIPKKYLISFVKFWYNFLVGDTPEFFVLTLAIIAIGITLHKQRPAFMVSVFALTGIVFGVSLYRGRQKKG